ncbi:Cof-type HAD-IIB family hydrolase [Lachnospiraceae bacterium OttesenSCG-928-D06]|nr:Cof-type HAD-IIB family hydrolase [Lachnospiraceae bacterium OttesenSCG-928-D06]
MEAIDLHVHSIRSDGTYTPTELVDYAMEKGLAAFALTDHDTIAGLDEAITYAESLKKAGQNPPLVIPGIEFSTKYQNREIHILGLFLDYKNPSVQEKLTMFLDSRTKRNKKMCKLLQEHGFNISYEALLEEFPGAVITRAHFAKYLLPKKYVKTIKEAFDSYIGDDCPYYVPREKVTPVEAIHLTKEAGGIPILAHPFRYHLSEKDLEALIITFKEEGLVGIEGIYSSHTNDQERTLRKLSKKHNLLLSGGSDFHGTNKPGLDLKTGYGSLFVPYEILTHLQNFRRKLLFTDMDGTLLNDACEISPKMKSAIDKLVENGHYLILSSGRPLPSILEVREKLQLLYNNMLIISNNGALVYDPGKEVALLEHRISSSDIRFITEKAKEHGLHIQGYTKDSIVCNQLDEEVAFYTKRIHLPVICTHDISTMLPHGSYKLQVIHLTDRSKLEAFRDELLSLVGEQFQFIFSNDQYLEVLPIQAGKGQAITFVRDYLHVLPVNTYAAGDAENDLSMLEAAHMGIAMKNASDFVKTKADMITQNTNNEDGLLEIINRFFFS